MPNEIICQNQDVRLAVDWARREQTDGDVVDVACRVGLTTWKAWSNPDETIGGWKPHGTAWVLDREGINKLIRTLRRARDQVYGRDE